MGSGSPIARQDARTHVTVERRMRPVGHALRMSVFHRVEVDVIDVRAQVRIVADEVFPESRLPWAATAYADPAGEPFLHVLDKPGIVVPCVPHPYQGMQVIGQHDNRNEIVWNAVFGGKPCLLQ